MPDAAGAPQYLIVGRIRRAHGIRGEVVVEGLTGDPERHFSVGAQLLAGTVTGEVPDPAGTPGPHTLTVRRVVPFKGGWILRLAEISDRNAAEVWRDRYLLVPAGDATPPAADEVYYHDLLGMRIEDVSGHALGTVAELYEVPQGVLLEVDTGAGRVMVPYRAEVVRSADLTRRVLVVDPPEGLFDVNEQSSGPGDQPVSRAVEQSNGGSKVEGMN